MEKLVIIGISNNALNAYRFIKDYALFDVVGFAVNREYLDKDEFCGLPVYAIEELDRFVDKRETKVFVALLWNRLNADRKKLYLELKAKGYHFANLISPKAVIHSEYIKSKSWQGKNCWIHDYVVIQDRARIGSNVAIMALSLIGDNTVIGDHCFLGAKSTVAGGCTIGEQTFVGINCTVFDDTIVGKKCILGACTAVKRNVPDYSRYVTSSDMKIIQYDENTIEEKLLFRLNKR